MDQPVGDTQMAKSNDKVQRFVQKLWKIVNSKSDLVGWSADGSRVVVHRPKDFAKRILPRYFNTANMSSFTRQLHFYGFKKTLTAKRSRAENWECQHEFFVRDHPEMLVRITRKRCNVQMASQEETSQLRKEIDELRSTVARQQQQMQSMAAMLLALNSTHDADRKRKASAHYAGPKQEPRVHQPIPALQQPTPDNSNGHQLFTRMRYHSGESIKQPNLDNSNGHQQLFTRMRFHSGESVKHPNVDSSTNGHQLLTRMRYHSGESVGFTRMRYHSGESVGDAFGGMALNDLGDLQDLTNDDFNYWS